MGVIRADFSGVELDFRKKRKRRTENFNGKCYVIFVFAAVSIVQRYDKFVKSKRKYNNERDVGFFGPFVASLRRCKK